MSGEADRCEGVLEDEAEAGLNGGGSLRRPRPAFVLTSTDKEGRGMTVGVRRPFSAKAECDAGVIVVF